MSWKRLVSSVVYLLALVCGLFVVATYGLALPDEPFAPVAIVGPTSVDSDGTLTAIADSESRRLLLLDGEDRLVGMVKYDTVNTPIEAIAEVCVSDGMVYVSGVKYQKDSDYVAQERVLAYDRHGAYRGTVYEVADPLGAETSIKSLDAAPDGVAIGEARIQRGVSYESQYLQFYRLRGSRVTELATTDPLGITVYDCAYNMQAGSYAITTDLGALIGSQERMRVGLHEGHIFSVLDMADDGSVYAYDEKSRRLVHIASEGTREEVLEERNVTQVALNGELLLLCDRAENEVIISDVRGTATRSLSEVMPVSSLSALFLAVLICRLVLALLVAALVIRHIVTVVRTGDTSGLGGLLASTSVVLAVAIAIAHLSYQAYQGTVQTRLDTINAFAEYYRLIAPGLAEDVERCADRDIFQQIASEDETTYSTSIQSYTRIVEQVENLVAAASNNGIGTYARIYGRDDEGIFYLFDGVQEHVFGASLSSPNEERIYEAFANDATDTEELHEGSTRHDTTQYRLVPLQGTDGKTVYAVIEVGSRMRTFEVSVMSGLTERIASLLVMMAVLYLTYAELRGCGRSLLDYRGYLGKDDLDALALLTRPFTFCITALSSIDSVMTVLIAKELAVFQSVRYASLLVPIPSVMLGIGLALGHVLYGFVGSKTSPRRLGMYGSLVLAVFSLGAVLAIWQKSFVLYCVTKLLISIPLGTLYSFGYSLPRRADTDKVRGPAQEGVTRTDTSAAAIGTVLGGYAAQILGNLWVYVLMAVAAILVAAFAHYVFPAHMRPIERQHVRSLRQTLEFLGSSSILPIIMFVMFPVVMAGGYDSYLFPLFSSDVGIDTSTIHNISAFGKLIVYVMIGEIGRVSDRLDKWAVAPASVALIGVTFLVFSLNSTLTWAILVIAVVAVLSKSSDGWKALWLRSAESRSFPRGRTVGLMFATRSMLLVIQPLILSALLLGGERVTIIVLGVVCVLCAAAFWKVTKNSELVPKGWTPPEPPDLFAEE